MRLFLGHYAGPEGAMPTTAYTLEITDTNISSVFRSDHLEPACLNWLCPHPLNYKLVWSQTRYVLGMLSFVHSKRSSSANVSTVA